MMNIKPVYLLFLFVVVLQAFFSSCRQGWTSNLIEEKRSFGQYTDSLDTLRMHQYLHWLVEKDSSKLTVDQMVKHRYDSLGTAIWFSEDGIDSSAYATLQHIRSSIQNDGLNHDAFLIEDIEKDLDIVEKLAFDSLGVDINEVLMRLDYNLSKSWMRYVKGQRYGFVRPDKVFNRLYYREDRGYYAHLFDYEIELPDYKVLLGHLEADDKTEYMQQSEPVNNTVYKALQTKLQSVTDSAERRKCKVSMERCRWRLKHPKSGERYVLVNLPAQQLWAMGNKTPLSMKICCGAWNTKTPLLASEIGYMQVNPEWSLPPKIVESDFKRHVGDSAWFARHKYFVVSRKTGDTLNIAHIGHDGLRNGGLRFVQRGGSGNSLGRIVFRFASSFSVYLHDTNTPWVFERDRRTVSHGCIRVERPFDLAKYFIPEADDWTLDKIRISMDIPPVTEQGQRWLSKNGHRTRPFRLISYYPIKPKVPVYIVYYTAYPNPETGVVEMWPDFYGYDKPIAAAMGRFYAE